MKRQSLLKAALILFGLTAYLHLAGCGVVFVNRGSQDEPLRDGLEKPSDHRVAVTVPSAQKVICDFEDGTTLMNPRLWGAPNGSWSAYSYAGNTVNYPFIVPGGANGTREAAHVSGTLVNKGDATYPAFILAGKFKPNGTHDASAFTGIRFYYQCPSSDQALARRFAIPIAPTVPSSSGGTCASDCYNHFGQDLTVTDGWVLKTVPFKDLQRVAGWGSPVGSPEFPDHLTEIIDIEWNHNSANTAGKYNIDYWVDEVEFY